MITDWHFYAVAVPAVLLMGLAKSGFGMGFGALCVPLMALAVPVPQAAAIFLPLLAVMDGMGLFALMRQADRSLLRLLMPASMLGIGLGWLLFGVLPAKWVAGLVGLVTLVFLAIRLLFPAKADSPPPAPWVGRLLAAISGFTSFVAHAGGPPMSFYLLPQRLTPVVFTATSAVLFAAINAAKWVPYAALGLIDATNLMTSLVLLPVAPIGVMLGLRFVHRVNPTWFFRLVYAGMLATGIKLLSDAFR